MLNRRWFWKRRKEKKKKIQRWKFRIASNKVAHLELLTAAYRNCGNFLFISSIIIIIITNGSITLKVNITDSFIKWKQRSSFQNLKHSQVQSFFSVPVCLYWLLFALCSLQLTNFVEIKEKEVLYPCWMLVNRGPHFWAQYWALY